MMFAPIDNPTILIKPSAKLHEFILTLKKRSDMPIGVQKIIEKKPISYLRNTSDYKYYVTVEDRKFMNNLNLQNTNESLSSNCKKCSTENLLCLTDLYWLYDELKLKNEANVDKMYFHELFEGSKIILPENMPIERNQDLENRCKLLRNQQANLQYKEMTKNVDVVRHKLPEDTISYQLKQINKQLIAIAQFIFSVITGFVFGFLGIELIIGNLDFGFRLLLGIICALVIALAELYFLAKKLNENLEIEKNHDKKVKIS